MNNSIAGALVCLQAMQLESQLATDIEQSLKRCIELTQLLQAMPWPQAAMDQQQLQNLINYLHTHKLGRMADET